MVFLGRWFIVFGLFLLLCGVAGFLSNPAGAKTALISGGTFGLLNVGWGVLLLVGVGLVRWLAGATTLMLLAVFAWRSSVTWAAVAAGEPKLFAAVLISLMFVAALLSFVVLLRHRAHGVS